MTKELIICECLTELTLSAQATCIQCKRELLTSTELRDLRTSLDLQSHNLRVQSAQIDIELHLRSVRKPSRPYLLREDFFANLKGKPQGSTPTKKVRNEQELRAEAATLLDMV